MRPPQPRARRARTHLRTLSAASRDACLALVIVLCGGLLFVQLDTAERVSSALSKWERIELDDLLLGSFLAVAVMTWFAVRRWRDASLELRARQLSEQENARYVQRLEELSTQLLETEQHERARLSELLHDEVGQTLYACRLQLERARQHVDDRAARLLLAEAHDLAGAAMARTRELTVDLSPPVLHDLGLAEALAWLVRRTQERFGLSARFVPGDDWQRIPPAWEAAVFHSVSELITNAAKHAQATQLEVSAAPGGDGKLRVSVQDDGRGFVTAQLAAKGFGLFSIERRMAWFGAELQVESAPGAGTRATLHLPARSASTLRAAGALASVS
jgi:signal transduction histidine kinase